MDSYNLFLNWLLGVLLLIPYCLFPFFGVSFFEIIPFGLVLPLSVMDRILGDLGLPVGYFIMFLGCNLESFSLGLLRLILEGFFYF